MYQHWKYNVPLPADKALPSASWKTVDLCFKGGVLIHVQFLVHQDPLALLCRAALLPVAALPVLVHGVISPQIEDLKFPIPELHEVAVGSLLQVVEVPRNGSIPI